MLNVFLLLSIVVLPFTTSLLATYLNRPAGGHLAAVVYALSLFVASSLFFLMQCHLLLRRRYLLRYPPTALQVRFILVRAALALPTYLVAGGLGLVSPYLTLTVCILLGVFYLLAPPSSGYPEAPPTGTTSG
ncbi:hypothetical protein ACXR2W_05950 [Leucobacter sp. HY1908]